MASKTVPKLDPQDPAVRMLEQIVVLANAADRQSYYLPTGCEPEEMELHADRMRELACTMGWLAERALTELGTKGALIRNGIAENWLMPPVCRSGREAPHG